MNIHIDTINTNLKSKKGMEPFNQSGLQGVPIQDKTKTGPDLITCVPPNTTVKMTVDEQSNYTDSK